MSACGEIGIRLRTLKRWQRAFLSDVDGKGRRKGSPRLVVHRLREEERQRILLTCNQPEYASLLPALIVPALARSGPLYRLREQLLSGPAPGRAVVPTWAGPAAAGTALRDAPDGGWPKPGLELVCQLFADHGAGGVAVNQLGGRRLEPLGGGLGCGRGGDD